MITFQQNIQYNNSFNAKPVAGKNIIKHSRINKQITSCYNKTNIAKGIYYMDIDNANRIEIADLITKRATSLPETIDLLFYNIGQFLNGNTNKKNFVDFYCKKIEPLYRRIAEGQEKEAFRESYAPEIKMLSSIRNSISNINNGRNEILEDVVEKQSREYLKTRIYRKQYFAV